MLYEFNETLVLEYKGWWFLWEPAWDSFRPIDNIQWNGSKFVIDDKLYCSDPTDPLYGYKTSSMKQVCELLTEQRKETPVQALPLKNPEWFFDRRVSLTACAPRDIASWKRMVKGKHRTCRKAPKGNKFTRRYRK